MFKLMNTNNSTNNKAFSQQRAVLKPMKNVAIFEEEELEDDAEIELEEEVFMDDSSSSYSGTMTAIAHDSRNETMLLAQFLSSTGPEEYAKQDTRKQQQFKRASRLLSRLRKRPTMPVLRSATGAAAPINNTNATTVASPTHTEKKMNYIPLPVYDHHLTDLSTSQQPKKESNNKKSNTTSTSTNNTSNQITKTKRQQQQQQQQQQQVNSALRDSGIYSETNSEKDSSVTSTSTAYGPLPPLPPFTTVMSELQFPHPPYAFKSSSPNNYQQQQSNPRRPAPLPPALASAAIATATSVCSSDGGTSTSTRIRSVPEAALKRRSVRLRHVQVQTTNEDDGDETTNKPVSSGANTSISADKQACPHCRQYITATSNRLRRPSCPPALSSGPALVTMKDTEDAKVLLAMIMKLKSQLEEEKQCRLKLEKAIHQRQSDDRREQLAKERDRWAGDCLWLNDRIALLPE